MDEYEGLPDLDVFNDSHQIQVADLDRHGSIIGQYLISYFADQPIRFDIRYSDSNNLVVWGITNNTANLENCRMLLYGPIKPTPKKLRSFQNMWEKFMDSVDIEIYCIIHNAVLEARSVNIQAQTRQRFSRA